MFNGYYVKEGETWKLVAVVAKRGTVKLSGVLNTVVHANMNIYLGAGSKDVEWRVVEGDSLHFDHELGQLSLI